MSDSPLKKAIDEMTAGPSPIHFNCACDPALQEQVSAADWCRNVAFNMAAREHDRMQALLHGVDYALDDDLPVPENIADIMQAVPIAWPCPAGNDDPPSPDLTIEKP